MLSSGGTWNVSSAFLSSELLIYVAFAEEKKRLQEFGQQVCACGHLVQKPRDE